MLEKKYVLGLCIIFLSFSVIGQDTSVDVLENVGNKRCVENGVCEYFEDEFTCESDCNAGALEEQREIERNDLSENNAQNTTGAIPVENENAGSSLIVFSGLFIAFILIFLTGLYYWIHKGHKKHDSFKEHRTEAEKIPERVQNIQTHVKPFHLPKKPHRRL